MAVHDAPRRLSELTALIAGVLAGRFAGQTYWVVADVTNHTFRAEKNYHYFDLVEKDPDSRAIIARMRVSAWGKGSLSIGAFQQATGQRFTNNINVLVNVSVDFHAAYGLQLVLNAVDVNFTLGVLEQQRQATLDRLVRENPAEISFIEGLYATQNKGLRLKQAVRRVAVISSPTSAGWQDFHHTLEHNPMGYRIAIDDYFTVVQGENNANQILSCLERIRSAAAPYDCVVIVRGGGAQTDFLIFDDYDLGLAVATYPLPIITGIGHQKNETITDLMAHTQTKTPTKAAEFILAHNQAFEEALLRLQKKVVITAQQLLAARFKVLAQMNAGVVNHARELIFNGGQALLLARARLSGEVRFFLQKKAGGLAHYDSVIKLVSPENTLKRGFVMVRTPSAGIVTGAASLEPGQPVDLVFHDSTVTATVITKKDRDGREFDV